MRTVVKNYEDVDSWKTVIVFVQCRNERSRNETGNIK